MSAQRPTTRVGVNKTVKATPTSAPKRTRASVVKKVNTKQRTARGANLRSAQATTKPIRKRTWAKVPSSVIEKSAKATTKETPKNTLRASATVTIPTRVPLRLIERKILFERLLSTEGLLPAKRIAVGGGLCFVLIGATVFWSSSSYFSIFNATQSALLECVDTTSCPQSDDELETDQLLPSISFVGSLPEVVVGDTPVVVVAEGAVRVMLVLSSYETGQKIEVLLESFANGWRGTIPFHQLSVGKYALRARADFLHTVIRTDERYFYIREQAVTSENSTPVVESSETSQLSTTTLNGDTEPDPLDEEVVMYDEQREVRDEEPDALIVDEEDMSATSERTRATQDAPDTNDVMSDPTIQADGETSDPTPEHIETNVNNQEQIKETTTLTETILPLDRPDLTANVLPNATWLVSMQYPKNLRFVEIYIRNTRSTSVQFAGLAKQYSTTEWRYFITNEVFPPGTYEVLARSRSDDGRKIESAPVLITLTTSLPTDTVSSNTDSNTDPVPTNALPTRDYVQVADTIDTTQPQLTSEGMISVDRTLLHRIGEINDALQSYAAANQTEDPIMIDSSRRRLQQLETDAIAEQIASGGGITEAERITDQFRSLRQKVETFEKIRAERDTESIAIDSDTDGISDYDETNLFGTDPNNPDTDGDGIGDGVELTRGFNPLDSVENVRISYESPREVIALAVPDILSITSVKPVISQAVQTEDRTPEPPVLTQISGTALPYSYVNIYIFSTPTIVTVKTDADGSFVYTFEKELQDGSHEVYVAITDNTGSIVARSNPFRFVKEAQAFTPIDAAADVVITSTPLPDIQAQNAYSMVAGIGVLALGVILLMLGLGLRPPEDEVTTEAQPSM